MGSFCVFPVNSRARAFVYTVPPFPSVPPSHGMPHILPATPSALPNVLHAYTNLTTPSSTSSVTYQHPHTHTQPLYLCLNYSTTPHNALTFTLPLSTLSTLLLSTHTRSLGSFSLSTTSRFLAVSRGVSSVCRRRPCDTRP